MINKIKPIYAVYLIVSIGLIVRWLYFQKYGVMYFQHDWQGHVEFIKYISNNWSLPIPTRGWEFPQQSLYYIIAGILYKLQINLGLKISDAIHNLGYLSIIYSYIFLIYSTRVISLLSNTMWIRIVSISFLSMTPSIVYLSARINNDVLVLSLSAVSLFYIIKSYKSHFITRFYFALTSVSLLFLTKISSFSFEIILFLLLVVSYMNSDINSRLIIKKNLYIFGLVGIFLLSFTLVRVYMPIGNSFYMVNSGSFPNQTIENLDFTYFLSLDIKQLLKVGYSYVFGDDSIRHSFLTYQYGTMFFGEFNYTDIIDIKNYEIYIMRIILLMGLLYPLGLLIYFLYLHKESRLNKILTFAVFINLILILKFVISYPSICNTDFRYFVPSYIIIGFMFARGLYDVRAYKVMRYITDILLLILFLSEIIFFYILL